MNLQKDFKVMEDLKDYGGPFKSDLKFQDFSKDALVGLIRAAGRIYGGIDQRWYQVIVGRLGQEVASDLQKEVWYGEGGCCDLEIRSLTTDMNFSGNDVASYMKIMQLLPAMATLMDIEFDLKDNNHCIMTVKRCRPLEHYERTGETALQKQLCEVLEKIGYEEGAKRFNPRMEVTAIKIPPRKSQDDIACQWEFKLNAAV
ncbi:DUF6125 family protein [Chloroflexota bacterium]